MAFSPEVGSSQVPSEHRREALAEKSSTEREQTSTLDSSTPISNLYLTWKTEVPAIPAIPAHLRAKDPNVDLPKCPNISKYISPTEWHPARKAVALILSCIATFITGYSAGSYSPPSRAMAHDLGSTNTVTLVGITSFCMGFAFAPMALAPLSELWGRYPIFVVSGAIFMIFQGVCAVMETVTGLIVARFFVGVGGSVFSAVVGGVISDIWTKEQRNLPMSIFSGAVLSGTGAGPLVAAALLETAGDDTLAWQWSFWHQMIMAGVLLLALILFFRESRASVLLTRKAHALNKWYEKLEEMGVYGFYMGDMTAESADPSVSSSNTSLGLAEQQKLTVDQREPSEPRLRRIRWVVKEDQNRPPLAKLIGTSVCRPFWMLFTEPIVFCFSLWSGFSWGILFMSFAVVPYIYGRDFSMSFRVYTALIAAAIVATFVSIWQEQLLKHPQWRKHSDDSPTQYTDSKFWAFMRRRFPAESPESRLYFACITAMLLPAGLYGGFMMPSSMLGYAPAIGLGFANWGIYSVYLTTFNYLSDSYETYASSALAAQSFCRNVLGGAFAVITSMIFRDLGLRASGGLLGGIATGLTLIPWALVFLGPKIRARSKFAISLQQ